MYSLYSHFPLNNRLACENATLQKTKKTKMKTRLHVFGSYLNFVTYARGARSLDLEVNTSRKDPSAKNRDIVFVDSFFNEIYCSKIFLVVYFIDGSNCFYSSKCSLADP